MLVRVWAYLIGAIKICYDIVNSQYINTFSTFIFPYYSDIALGEQQQNSSYADVLCDYLRWENMFMHHCHYEAKRLEMFPGF